MRVRGATHHVHEEQPEAVASHLLSLMQIRAEGHTAPRMTSSEAKAEPRNKLSELSNQIK